MYCGVQRGLFGLLMKRADLLDWANCGGKGSERRRLRCLVVKQWPAYRLDENRSIRCTGSRKMRFQMGKPSKQGSLYAALVPEVFIRFNITCLYCGNTGTKP